MCTLASYLNALSMPADRPVRHLHNFICLGQANCSEYTGRQWANLSVLFHLISWPTFSVLSLALCLECYNGEKNENFIIVQNWQFLLCFLILRNPPIEIGEIAGMSLMQMHILVFGDPPLFLSGQTNCNFGQNFRQDFQMAASYSTTRRNMGNRNE